MKKIFLKILATLAPVIAMGSLIAMPYVLIRTLSNLFKGDPDALGYTVICLIISILSLGYLAVILKFDKKNYK